MALYCMTLSLVATPGIRAITVRTTIRKKKVSKGSSPKSECSERRPNEPLRERFFRPKGPRSRRRVAMRNPVAAVIIASLAVVALSSAVMAQGQEAAPRPRRQVQPGYVAEGVPKMPNPPGPAPKQDLTGAWVGPQNVSRDPMPPMTPAGEARFKQNKPYVQGGAREGDVKAFASNDPFITCDPLGFPRDLLNHAVSSRGGMLFQPAGNRMLILFEQQRVWREVWMDGRQLPGKVD